MSQQLFRQGKVPSIDVRISEDLRESNKLFVGDQEQIINLSCKADEIRTLVRDIINKLKPLWIFANCEHHPKRDVSKEFYKANQSLSVGDSSIIASNRWNEISKKAAPYVLRNSKFANITKQTFVDPPIIPSQHLSILSEAVIPSSSITKSTHRPTVRSSAVSVRNRREIINRTTPYSNSSHKADKQRHSNKTLDAFSEIISPTINGSTCKNSEQIVLYMESADPANITNQNPPYINPLSLLGFESLYYPNSLEFNVIDPTLLYLNPPSFTNFSYGRSSDIHQETSR
ncbi:13865_t:CDS:2 [Acaulospora morrowiae]|uniref:13865_t:CDS:1 n=1 Tax=Acaulospora morrowiae TaxID=94023 RepID=A0A9N9D8K4_9GLOM|nr:13865_t:CDS:2 [Acaulospora morrowiae]